MKNSRYKAIALLLFITTATFSSDPKDNLIVVHYKNQPSDTIISEIQYSHRSGQFIKSNDKTIFPEETLAIEFFSNQLVHKGTSAGDSWFFEVIPGSRFSIYSQHPETYSSRELYYSLDSKTFSPLNKENLKKLEQTGTKSKKEIKKYFFKDRFQKALMYSNATVIFGLLTLPSPVGIGLISFGLLNSGGSMLFHNSANKHLTKVVEAINEELSYNPDDKPEIKS